MRPRFLRFLVIPLVFSLLTSCGGTSSSIDDSMLIEQYGSNFYKENTIADKAYIYGMCDLAWSDNQWYGVDYREESDLIKSIGAKSVRNWMQANWIIDSKGNYDEKGLALQRSIVENLHSQGFQIIGMNHYNFHKAGCPNSSSDTAKPARDLSEGSYYRSWLELYQQTWYKIVVKFPEIKYWEIDNEPNNDDFFPKLEGGLFNLKQKAEIYTDMMYYASLGIHAANPSAYTVMGGLVTSNAPTFMQYIYDNIIKEGSWSKFPDDYFQVACWHPYMSYYSHDGFKTMNDNIYSVIQKNEGKNKKVFLTEAGFSEINVNLDKINIYIPDMYKVVRDELPYVESMHYFRMFDNLDSTWGSIAEKKFGLFTDPTEHGNDNENPNLASPKITAYTYQKEAGGEGSLTSYQEKLCQIKGCLYNG